MIERIFTFNINNASALFVCADEECVQRLFNVLTFSMFANLHGDDRHKRDEHCCYDVSLL